MDKEIIGVIGAGIMGTGVVLNLVSSKKRVILVDTSKQILESAKEKIQSDYRLYRFIKPQLALEDIETLLDRIIFTDDVSMLQNATYVIENITECVEKKEKLYREIDKICNPDVIFAANTSAISITQLASYTQRPDRIVGIHFMNPVPLKKMVEVIRAMHTSDATLKRTERLLQEMEKSMVIVNDWPGFVSNRVLMLTINEAIFLVQDAVASSVDIDQIFKGCFEHKMGPLETADMIGLDTILQSLEVLYDSFNDSKYRPSPLLKKMVAGGLLGRKSGQGFYSYVLEEVECQQVEIQ